jgi:hypothetical protein
VPLALLVNATHVVVRAAGAALAADEIAAFAASYGNGGALGEGGFPMPDDDDTPVPLKHGAPDGGSSKMRRGVKKE